VLLQCPASSKPTSENIERIHSFMGRVERPDGRLLWEPRGDWPTAVLADLCREHRLVHVVDPMQTETVTPHDTYYRLHGTTGSRHVHTDDELAQLRDRVAERPTPYVLFNNLPRVGDAARFMALVSGAGPGGA
jgi:uncharacterized protein YecE (DUF72 family)